jgi:HEPN domain-containing protein
MINNEVKNWVIKALEDFDVSKHELSMDKEIVTTAVCFHSQQCVEKLLKSYLVLNNKDFERTHNLPYLLELCSKIDLEFKTLNVKKLTFFSIEVRYPDEFYTPTIDEAKECFQIASTVKDFVFIKLGVKVEDFKK